MNAEERKYIRHIGRLTRAIRRAKHKRFMLYMFQLHGHLLHYRDIGQVFVKSWGLSRNRNIWHLEVLRDMYVGEVQFSRKGIEWLPF